MILHDAVNAQLIFFRAFLRNSIRTKHHRESSTYPSSTPFVHTDEKWDHSHATVVIETKFEKKEKKQTKWAFMVVLEVLVTMHVVLTWRRREPLEFSPHGPLFASTHTPFKLKASIDTNRLFFMVLFRTKNYGIKTRLSVLICMLQVENVSLRLCAMSIIFVRCWRCVSPSTPEYESLSITTKRC